MKIAIKLLNADEADPETLIRQINCEIDQVHLEMSRADFFRARAWHNGFGLDIFGWGLNWALMMLDLFASDLPFNPCPIVFTQAWCIVKVGDEIVYWAATIRYINPEVFWQRKDIGTNSWGGGE